MVINGRKIEGAIFDIDGTLVDSFPVYCAAFNKGIKEYELEPFSNKVLIGLMKSGGSLTDIFRKVFPPDADDLRIEECRQAVLRLFLKAEVDEVKPFPGVDALFQSLRSRGVRIGIATGRTSLPEREWERFKRYGLDGLIDCIVTSREVERRKPAPDAILECARRLKVPIEHCLVVGDTDADIIASKSAGAVSVAICTGQDDFELLEKENPEFIFSNLVDLDLFLNQQ